MPSFAVWLTLAAQSFLQHISAKMVSIRCQAPPPTAWLFDLNNPRNKIVLVWHNWNDNRMLQEDSTLPLHSYSSCCLQSCSPPQLHQDYSFSIGLRERKEEEHQYKLDAAGDNSLASRLVDMGTIPMVHY